MTAGGKRKRKIRRNGSVERIVRTVNDASKREAQDIQVRGMEMERNAHNGWSVVECMGMQGVNETGGKNRMVQVVKKKQVDHSIRGDRKKIKG